MARLGFFWGLCSFHVGFLPPVSVLVRLRVYCRVSVLVRLGVTVCLCAQSGITSVWGFIDCAL